MAKTDRRNRQKSNEKPTWRSSQPTAPDEEGAVFKDWGGRISIALTMPNTYYIGMSSLALQLLYRMFNAEPDVVCERVFWEKGAAMAGKPLLSLETWPRRRRV